MSVCKACSIKIPARMGVRCNKCNICYHIDCIPNKINSATHADIISGKATYTCETCINRNTIKEDAVSLKDLFKELSAIKSKQDNFFETNEKLNARHEEFSKSIELFNSKCSVILKMEKDLVEHDGRLLNLEKENINLKNNIADLSLRLTLMERFNYASNIEVRGIPVVKNENLCDIVNVLAQYVGVSLNMKEVKFIHRSFSRSNMKPIIIQFQSKFQREQFLMVAATKEIKTSDIGFSGSASKVFVGEHFPPWKKQLFYQAKSLKVEPFNYGFVWMKYGKIYAKKGAVDGTIQINSFEALKLLKDGYATQS